MPQCPNCSAPFEGEYCPACGQAKIHPDSLSARHFVKELADELAGLRFKFKTIHSLRALLTPGRLTADYLAGRRGSDLGPIKLYLVCAALFFLAAPLAGFTLTSLIDDDESGTLVKLVSIRMSEVGIDRARFNERFDRRLQSVYTASLAAGVITVALMLQVLFARKGQPFGAHLVFAIHYVSFMYLLTTAAGATRLVGLSSEVASAIAFSLIAVYLTLAVRRVYAGSTLSILLKSGLLLVVTSVVNYYASLGAILLTLALV